MVLIQRPLLHSSIVSPSATVLSQPLFKAVAVDADVVIGNPLLSYGVRPPVVVRYAAEMNAPLLPPPVAIENPDIVKLPTVEPVRRFEMPTLPAEVLRMPGKIHDDGSAPIGDAATHDAMIRDVPTTRESLHLQSGLSESARAVCEKKKTKVREILTGLVSAEAVEAFVVAVDTSLERVFEDETLMRDRALFYGYDWQSARADLGRSVAPEQLQNFKNDHAVMVWWTIGDFLSEASETGQRFPVPEGRISSFLRLAKYLGSPTEVLDYVTHGLEQAGFEFAFGLTQLLDHLDDFLRGVDWREPRWIKGFLQSEIHTLAGVLKNVQARLAQENHELNIYVRNYETWSAGPAMMRSAKTLGHIVLTQFTIATEFFDHLGFMPADCLFYAQAILQNEGPAILHRSAFSVNLPEERQLRAILNRNFSGVAIPAAEQRGMDFWNALPDGESEWGGDLVAQKLRLLYQTSLRGKDLRSSEVAYAEYVYAKAGTFDGAIVELVMLWKQLRYSKDDFKKLLDMSLRQNGISLSQLCSMAREFGDWRAELENYGLSKSQILEFLLIRVQLEAYVRNKWLGRPVSVPSTIQAIVKILPANLLDRGDVGHHLSNMLADLRVAETLLVSFGANESLQVQALLAHLEAEAYRRDQDDSDKEES